MGFAGNLLGFPAVKEFLNSVKNLRSYCHEFGVQFFGPPCILLFYIIIILMTSFTQLKQRLLVEWRKPDHSIIVAAISQWRRRLGACVRAHGRQLSTFCGIFMILNINLTH